LSTESVLPTGRKTRALLAAVALSARVRRCAAGSPNCSGADGPRNRPSVVAAGNSVAAKGARAGERPKSCSHPRSPVIGAGRTWVDVDQIMRATTSKPAALALLDGELLEDLDGIDPAFDMWLSRAGTGARSSPGMAETLLREQTDPGTVHSGLRSDYCKSIVRIEEAWRALMRAHAEQGERGPWPSRPYDRCRAVLADRSMRRRRPRLRPCSMKFAVRPASGCHRWPPHPAPEPASPTMPGITLRQ